MVDTLWAARCLGRWAVGAIFVGFVCTLAPNGATAGQPEVRVAAMSPGGGATQREADLPRVLSDADAARYAHIFGLQVAGKWHAADDEIAKLGNRVLMGHVMAQRYLHPTRYRSKYRELKTWLKSYADHPQARRIYKLAMRRKPKDAGSPRRPVLPSQPGVVQDRSTSSKGYISARKRSRAERRKLINLIAHMRKHLLRNQLAGAAKHLTKKDFAKLADEVEFDIVRSEIAHAYFIGGKDRKAVELAVASAERSDRRVPLAHWTAGLALYRLGKLEDSRRHFEALVKSGTASNSMIAAAAFWAARLNLVTRRPENVSRLLSVAAAYPHTFHGLLANRALGTAPRFSWDLPTLTNREVALVMRVPAVVRALALVQAGRPQEVESELRRLDAAGSPSLGKAMLALATRLDLPTVQIRVGRRLAAFHGHRHDAAMYPVLQWQPRSGYVVDRALVYALIRQESQFNARAKSRVGARGLMQLMPRTASFIARDRRYHSSRRNKLYEPEINVELGQKYILHLLEGVEGNMMYLVAAYNGGPGNLKKWRRRGNFNDDPLLFIESLPSRETRAFMQKVLTNLWIYRSRLGQAAPSLDAIAAGGWPAYVPQDPTAVTADARN